MDTLDKLESLRKFAGHILTEKQEGAGYLLTKYMPPFEQCGGSIWIGVAVPDVQLRNVSNWLDFSG